MYSIPRGFVPLYRILVAIVALEGVALPPFRGFLRACAAFSKAPTQMTPLGLQRSCIRFPGGGGGKRALVGAWPRHRLLPTKTGDQER